MLNWIQSADWFLLQWVHAHLQCGFLDFIMPKISALGNVGAVWLLAAAVLLFTKKYRKFGLMIIVGIAADFVLGNLILKTLTARPRPCWIDTSVQMLVSVPTDYSFPSGHTLASVTAAVLLMKANRKFAFAAVPLAVLIAFSRLYLYLHFPSDVLASVLFGILTAAAAFWCVNQVYPLLAGGFPQKDKPRA
ncbi:MAG: phosphatase PAP2 family protein [Oscillospiraceae bacterium]|jgi:undecaprenyl-diphosphatase|nr:phosphatase PAP2 family protein [Oscillospiraceae bacterium]MDD3260391.1 phosphatase PAP2 family protein [Oscillospiraceae bacterium]